MKNVLSVIKQYLKKISYTQFVAAACLLFVGLCCFFVTRERFWIPYLGIAVVGLYWLLYKTEFFFYLIAFVIPFSVELREIKPNVDFGFSLPSELMLSMLMLVFLLKLLIDKNYPAAIRKQSITLAIFFYLIWIFLTSITSTMPLVSFKFLFAKLWFIVPAYFFFAQLLYKKIRAAVTFFLSYASGLCLVVLITTYKHLAMADIRKVAYWIMSPYYNDHTAYGVVLAFFVMVLAVIPFIKTLPKWQRIYSFLLLIPMLVGLYLSYSRAAWLSVIVAMGVAGIMLLKIRMRTVAVVALVFVGLFFAFKADILNQLNKNTQDSSSDNFGKHVQSITNISSDASNVERLNRWVAVFGMFEEKPFLGFGPGTYQFQYAPYQKPAYRTIITTNAGTSGNAHSEYLGPLAESGVMGTVSVLLLLLAVFSTGVHTSRKAKNQEIRLLVLLSVLALTTYYFHGILNNFLDTEKLAIPVFGAMAVIAVCSVLAREEENNRPIS
jgi:O-antigen ligase